jgi:NAD-dependent dihydropyrimidine dehydrogenase PreA subunit
MGKPFYVSDKCKNHKDCINELACPAFFIENEKVKIDPDTCVGCTLCAQICPEHAILPLKEKSNDQINLKNIIRQNGYETYECYQIDHSCGGRPGKPSGLQSFG